MSANPETRFSLNNGKVFYYCIPWDISPNELKMCEEMIALSVQQIRSYQERIGHRHEWWLKWRGFAP